MIWAYGFLNERLVCLRATPARCVTSSNHLSPATVDPPARQATAISSAAAPPFFSLSADVVFFFDERIGTLCDLHDPVCRYVLKLLNPPGTGPSHHHLIDCRRIAHAEILSKRILRPVPVTQYHFAHLGLTFHHDRHAHPNRVPIRLRSHQFHSQPVTLRAHLVLEQSVPVAG